MNFKALLVLGMIVASSGGVLAAEKGNGSGRQLCILYAEACSGKMQSFQQKIQQIQSQLARGATVYNPKEIDRLEMKLKEAEEQMDRILSSTKSR